MDKQAEIAIFGFVLMLSIFLAGQTYYSNQIIALDNQRGQEKNEAHVENNIVQENGCEKDSECKNKNEINNQITNLNQKSIGPSHLEPVPSASQTCLTDNLSKGELKDFIVQFDTDAETEIATLDQLDKFINENQNSQKLDLDLIHAAEASITSIKYEEIIFCFQDAGIDVDFPVW